MRGCVDWYLGRVFGPKPPWLLSALRWGEGEGEGKGKEALAPAREDDDDEGPLPGLC